MADTRFSDLPDFYTDSMRSRLDSHQAFLGARLAVDHKGHWLMMQQNGAWTRFTKDAPALKAMVQHWGGRASPHNMDDDTVRKFMGSPFVSVVRGFMAVPTSDAPAIMFKGERYINSWDASAIAQPNAEAINDPALHDILTKTFCMFRENLCGRGADNRRDLDGMLAAARSDDPAELEWRFFMNFMAQPLQHIGHNMQCNTWLLGNINGLGRGTLTSLLLPLIYGRQNVVELQAQDVERGGWTDTLVNKLWVIINELTIGNTLFDWNGFVKSNSCEGVLRIRQRNVDPYDALNFANWIFTSNAEEPRCLDAKDRRNALIQCYVGHPQDDSKRQAACDLALDVYTWISQTQEYDPALVTRYIGGIVHLLQQHPVDATMLAYAPDTIIKGDVQAATSLDLKGLYWLQNDDDYPRNEVLPAHIYVEFHNRFVNAKHHVDGRAMGGMMAALSRRGLVRRHKPYHTKAAYWEIDSALFPRTSDADDAMREAAKAKVVSIAGLLPAARRR